MDTLERILSLKKEGARFAVATVVSRRAPVSSHLGDKAIVFEDGRMEGFVGGACSREVVRKQALEVLRLERPRLVRINSEAPAGTNGNEDELCVPMTCASEGALEVYVEPVLERRLMLVVGGSPIAVALARAGSAMRYEVVLACEDNEREAVALSETDARVERLRLDGLNGWLTALPEARRSTLEAVVASMGHYDEEALATLAKVRPRYLGLVASQKRGGVIRDALNDMGLGAGLERLRHPAGLDVGAKTPDEVALSILTEMVQLRRQASAPAEPPVEEAAEVADEAIDPVCGMTVSMGTRHQAEHDGTTYYFCCPNCKRRFEKEPAAYLAQPAAHPTQGASA